MFPCARNYKRTRGVSLLEMLLTVGIVSTFLLFVVEVGQMVAREQAVVAAANYVKRIDSTVQSILSNPDRFNLIHAAVEASPAFTAQLDIADLRNGTSVLTGVPLPDLLNDNFPDVGPYNQTYRIIMRLADAPLNAADPNALDVFIVSDTMIADGLVSDISSRIGGGGGSLRDTPDLATGVVRASYATWSFPLAGFAATAWGANVAANPLPIVDNGGYVVLYHAYDINRVAKDYLYRNNMGDPMLNTMHTDLSIGGYNLLGVDNLVSANGLTGTEMAVKGTGQISGGGTISGTLQADRRATAGGSVAPSGANTTLTVDNGALFVTTSGGVTAGVNVVGAQVENTVNTNLFTSNQIVGSQSVINGNLNVTTPVGVSATSQAAGLNVTGNTIINGTLRAADYRSGGNITVNSGRIGTVNMQTNALTVGSATLGSNGGTLERISVGGTARVNRLENCNEGC